MSERFLGLLDNVTTTLAAPGPGQLIGLQGERIMLGAASSNYQFRPINVNIVFTPGTSATVIIRSGPTIGGLSTIATIAFTATSTVYRAQFKVNTMYFGAYVSAITGGSVNGYIELLG